MLFKCIRRCILCGFCAHCGFAGFRRFGRFLRRSLHGDAEQFRGECELLREALEVLDQPDQREDIAAFAAGKAVPAGAVLIDREGAVGILAAVGAAAAERAVIQTGAFPHGNAREIFGQFCFQDIVLHSFHSPGGSAALHFSIAVLVP